MDNCKNICRFTSFNCHSFKNSIDDVRSLCNTSVLVCLQETWLLNHDIPLLGTVSDDFEYTGKSAVDTSAGILRGRPYGGVAILWKKGVFEMVSVVDCSSTRLSAIKATIGGRKILVFSVYMPVNSPDNLTIFSDILGEISAIEESNDIETVMLLGDFNAHPNELFYDELEKFCLDRSWVCADVNRLRVDSGSYTFVDHYHGSRRWLDHCVVSLSALKTVVNVGILEDVYMSDHLPIYIECDLDVIRPKLGYCDMPKNAVLWGERDESQICKYHDLCQEGLRVIDFPTEFTACSYGTCDLSAHKVIIESLYDRIVQVLINAAIMTKGGRKGRRRKKILCGWNQHVKEAHWDARLRFKSWVLHNRPSVGIVYEQMRESRKFFKGKLKWCRKNQDQIKMDVIANCQANKNFSQFWKATRKLDVRPGLPASVGGVSEPGDIANMFRNHFIVRSPLGVPDTMVNAAPCIQREEPLLRFTASQVGALIKGMTKGKSPGHDGLSVEHLKYAGVHLPRVLSLLFTMCISHAYLPADLMKTTVVPIVKNRTGDISDMNNYRPISLATVIAKVLDSLFDSCLEKWIKLHDAQFGFRPGLSTESAILSLKHTVQYYTDRKTPVYACFLDLSKAFDLVSYEVLWRKLGDSGVPVEMINIFKYWYNNQSNRVRWSGSLSDSYGLECGVRQGGLSSPKLFNLYVNDLIVELSSMRVGCRVGGVSTNNISYADDMVLLSPTAGALGEMLKVCEAYARSHGLVYNVSKSQYMVFKAAGKCPESVPPITLNGVSVQRVSQFKYLGHYLTDDLKDDVDIERERRALSVRGNMLARRFARCTDQVKVTLFKAYCQGLYTGGLWVNHTKKSLDTLRVQYNNIFRMMLGFPRFCSASEMFAHARTDCFRAVIRKKVGSLMRRVRGSHNSILKTIAEDVRAPVLRHFVRLMID